MQVRFTIAKDGSVKNIGIERLVGPTDFQDSVIDAVKQWTFRPATENGAPVESNQRRQFFFRIQNPEEGARPEVFDAYRKAMNLFDDKKIDEAAVVLQAILAKPDLDFYERGMASLALANVYASEQKLPEALYLIRDATIDNGKILAKNSQEVALRMRVRLEAANSNIAEALAWFDILKTHTNIPNDDPDAKFVANLHAIIDSQKPLAFAAMTPSATSVQQTGDDTWQHTLLKRSLGFADIQGHLAAFQLRCNSHGIESAVSDTARWTIPKSWTDCEIYVDGPPGTKFNFLEADADTPPAH